ncbi:MAG: NUDIX domain-containing protein [Planctomycetota bacterium]|jgi:rfaE bifunctional protein nucleotidyltransferase chain/domain|nr:NUDIX domain-containing protein [Planctomycetota bacterium]
MGKVVDLDTLAAEAETWRRDGKKVVWTNGCFDLFHTGHARALAEAKALGDVLAVGLNSDRSIRGSKAADRPIRPESDRAGVLAALAAVDRVVVFDGARCDREIAAVKPDIWAKSGDYTEESLDPGERRAILENGGKIVITPLVPGLSTTLIVKKIRRGDPEKIVSGSSALIVNERREILMVATEYADGVKWSLPGGGQMRGETLQRTAERETAEETGLKAAIGRHRCVIERIEPARSLHLVLHVFLASVNANGDFSRRTSRSAVDVAWFDRSRIEHEERTVLGRALWLDYLDDPDGFPGYVFLPPGSE